MSFRIKSIFDNFFAYWELIFAAFWILWVIITYLGYHPDYLELLKAHPYMNLLLITAVSSLLLSLFSYHKIKKTKKILIPIRGIGLVGVSLALGAVILLSFRQTMGLNGASTGSVIVHFVGYSSLYLLLLLFLGLVMLATGSFFTERLLFKGKSPLISIALGFSIVAFLSAFLAMFSLYTAWVLWPLIIGVIIFKRKIILHTANDWLVKKHEWKVSTLWELPMAFIGLVFISFYWLGSLKAYAVGFDGTALYANLAHLIANSSYLPGATQAYGWSLIMSLGECLFKNETLNILLSHFMFLPALIMGFQLARMWLKPSYSLLAMLIVLSMPFMGFHAMVDEKIDLGLLFISLSVLYLAVQWLLLEYPKGKFKFKEIFKNNYFYSLLLIGWLLGFAFTIKYTAGFLLMGLVLTILYRLSNKKLYLGASLILLALLFFSSDFMHRLETNPRRIIVVAGLFLTIGLVIVIYNSLKKGAYIKKSITSFIILGSSFALPFLPWAVKHLGEHQFNFSIRNILYGRPDRPTLDVFEGSEDLSLHYNISPSKNEHNNSKPVIKLTSDQNTTAPKAEKFEKNLIGDVKREEIQRYIGYEKGLWRYTSIPFDLPFSINIKGLRHQEIGFIFLALLPLLLLSFTTSKRKNLYHFLIIAGLIIWVSSDYWSITEASNLNEHINEMNLGNQAVFQNILPDYQHFFVWFKWFQTPFVYIGGLLSPLFKSLSLFSGAVYFPILTLLFILLICLMKNRVNQWPKSLKYLMMISFSILLLWVLLGNAIIWYLFPVLVVLPILIVFYFQKPDKFQGEAARKVSKKLIGTVIFLQLFSNTVVLFSSPYAKMESKALFQWPMIEYISRPDMDREKVQQEYNPVYYEITKEINRNPDAKVFRVNTYLEYHIDHNNWRVYEDNQLGQFDRICKNLDDETDFFKILKENGYRYILYDFNTPGLDQTPEKSLVEKCKKLDKLIRLSPSASLLITDHYVKKSTTTAVVKLPNGKKAVAEQGFDGEVVYVGSLALFEIK